MTEAQIQAILMRWVLDEKNHIMVAPNITSVFSWECDLLSLTRAAYSHEFEIKRTLSDYRADFTGKVSKHDKLSRVIYAKYLPNYFWYVTDSFDIEPPPYAGWIRLSGEFIRYRDIIRDAPRLHTEKASQEKLDALARNAAYKLKKLYVKCYLSVK